MEILDRLKTETPKFFKGVQKLGVVLLAIGVGLKTAPEGVAIPDLVVKLSGYLATAGFIMSTVASFAKVDSPSK